MPLVSVIVPVYNDQDYLPECLASIQQQTLRDIEVICVDDGSFDNSLALCRDFESRDKRFNVIALPKNKGVSHARNAALASATGDYIAFMDADDWYPQEDSLEKLYKAAIEHGAQVSAGSLQRFNEAEGGVMDIAESERGLLGGFLFDEAGWVDFADWQNDYGFYRFLYQRSLLQDNDISFPPLVRHEDPVFLVRALVAAGRFYAIPDVVYTLRVGYKSVQLGPKAMDDALEGVFQIVALCNEHGLDRLRQRQKLVLRRYFVDAQDMLQEYYLKDLLHESAQRIGRKAVSAMRRGRKEDGR